jgi:acetyltransferase-like isoleucine patch superfamily enzyme
MKILRISFGILHFVYCKILYWNRFKSRGISLFSLWSNVIIQRKGSIVIDGRVVLGKCSELRAIGKLKLGKGVYINNFSRIISHDNIEIGNNVLIAQFVSILDHDHHYFFKNGSIQFENYNVNPVKIGNNVLIGDKVTILKGTVIGDNVIIGANSLVKGTIPSNTMMTSPLADGKTIKLNQESI